MLSGHRAHFIFWCHRDIAQQSHRLALGEAEPLHHLLLLLLPPSPPMLLPSPPGASPWPPIRLPSPPGAATWPPVRLSCPPGATSTPPELLAGPPGSLVRAPGPPPLYPSHPRCPGPVLVPQVLPGVLLVSPARGSIHTAGTQEREAALPTSPGPPLDSAGLRWHLF